MNRERGESEKSSRRSKSEKQKGAASQLKFKDQTYMVHTMHNHHDYYVHNYLHKIERRKQLRQLKA